MKEKIEIEVFKEDMPMGLGDHQAECYIDKKTKIAGAGFGKWHTVRNLVENVIKFYERKNK